MRRIAVGVHASTGARLALRWAVRRASACGCDVHLVTAVAAPPVVVSPLGAVTTAGWIWCDSVPAPGGLRDMVAEEIRQSARFLTVTHEVRMGEAVTILRSAAREADLLVIGSSRRRARWRRSLGPGALGDVGCPVMVVDAVHLL